MNMLPKTKEGMMQFEYALIGIVVTTLLMGAFLVGMKMGFQYGYQACIV